MNPRYAFAASILLILAIFTGCGKNNAEVSRPIRLPAEMSGLSLTRKIDTPQFFDAIGRSAMILGLEDGTGVEGWDLPVKVFTDLSFQFAPAGSNEWREGPDLAAQFTVRPEYSTTQFRDEGIEIDVTYFAALRGPGGVIFVTQKSDAASRVRFSFVPDLQNMWPVGKRTWVEDVVWDGDVRAFVMTDGRGGLFGVAGLPGEPEVWLQRNPDAKKKRTNPRKKHLISDVGECAISFDLNPGEEAIFVFSGSTKSAADALSGYNTLRNEATSLVELSVQYYDKLRNSFLSIDTPDDDLDEAFEWAKVGLDKCFLTTPRLGSGYVAGFNRSQRGNRPGFAWYFGRDSAWQSFAALGLGDFNKVRDNLDLLAKHQLKSGKDKGKIYHELSAAGKPMFAAGDSTPFFVIMLWEYYAWTGDWGYIEQVWPKILDAVDWCYRQDTDGDLLMDNPPAGHEWYDAGGPNMISLEAVWARALWCASELAGERARRSDPQEGDDPTVLRDKWMRDFEKVRSVLNDQFWNSEGAYFYHNREKPGVFDARRSANPSFLLLWKLVEAEKAALQLQLLASEELTTPWGVRTNSTEDDIYDRAGYHEGRVWPYVTGLCSLAAYAYGDRDRGFTWLSINASHTQKYTLGYIGETFGGDREKPDGTPHQGWSESMVIQPLVEGLLGIEPIDQASSFKLAPQLPDGWDRVLIKNLRIGESLLHVEITVSEGQLSATAKNKGKTRIDEFTLVDLRRGTQRVINTEP